jgi:signal transduction histidine kinase
VEDDGKGFVVGDYIQPVAGAAKAGRGLINMHRRAARCGARLQVTSGPGGTRVCLELPRRFPDAELPAG